MSISAGTRIHFMGVGGIGMSGLATLCLEQGCIVSGCDAKLNSLGHRLQERGATISVGHDARHLTEPLDVVVYSSAVKQSEPELLQARQRGLRTISRGELLAELTEKKRLIAIAGAHGKTTTSGMAAEVLRFAGWDPTVVVGGMMRSTGVNARWGSGSYAVAETDESDGSFLHLFPQIAIVTNIDREHLNHYHDFDRLVAAFAQFVSQLSPSGTLIRCYDDALIRQALTHPSMISYGFDRNADVTIERLLLVDSGSRFRALYKGRGLGTFQLHVPGRHNVLNALAIISLGLAADIPLTAVKDALEQFQGTERRFQVFRLPGNIWFVEDYAHHPSEIQATLDAGSVDGRHRIAVFQPHRFSRTQSLEREFTTCFDQADGVIVTDIYPAFERPIPGISGERLAHLIKAHGHPCVRYVPKQELTSYVGHIANAGDTIFFLGAGDIGELCHDLAAQLHSPARATR